MAVKNIEVVKHTNGLFSENEDLLAVEEPLEIRIGYGNNAERKQQNIAVTMRTPGADLELATGFIFTEGIVNSINQIESIRHCEDLGKEEEKGNVVRVELKQDVRVSLKSIERNFYTSSSCGVCGKTSIDSIKTQQCFSISIESKMVSSDVLKILTYMVGKEQTVFKHTGGLHASALFDLSGNLLLLREDVGRHNALDKLIGNQFMSNNLPLKERILWLSGRLSFELVQKAAMAAIEIVVAVGAPSSLAVQLAKETGITTIGFLRSDSFNIYSHPERIK